MTNKEKLAQALKLLEEIASDMDVRSEPCACCGMKKNLNWPQKQAHDTLSGSIDKLYRLHSSADDRLEKK